MSLQQCKLHFALACFHYCMFLHMNVVVANSFAGLHHSVKFVSQEGDVFEGILTEYER